jgi:hypothetical protein
MGEQKTLGVKVDVTSDLYNDFQEFSEEYETRSEAMRAAMRKGIASEAGDEPDSDPDGVFAAGLSALEDDAYQLARDGVLFAVLVLLLQSAVTSFAPVWLGTVATVVTVAALAVCLLALVGAVAGLYAKLTSARTDSTADTTGAEA